MAVSESDVLFALRDLDVAGRSVCVHASLRSFGWVSGGAPTVVRGFLQAGCTLLVPTFTWRYAVQPHPEEQLPRNAWPPDGGYPATVASHYTPDTTEVDRDMGAVAATVARWPDRARGEHPLNSFSAVGPLAYDLAGGQRPRTSTPLYARSRSGAGV